MKATTLILIMIFYGSSIAQVHEDFSDGDLTNDPEWIGDTDWFKVSASSAIPSWHRPGLQLDAAEAGAASLSLPVGLDESVYGGPDFNWSFWLKQSYNSSANNFSRIYLVSSNPNLTGPQNGYFIQIGGADDSVRFCRQDSTDVVCLLTIKDLNAGGTSNAFRFLVIKSGEGLWKFYADPSGGQSLHYCGETTDQEYAGLPRFGIWTSFTLSNSTKFYFDELTIKLTMPDTEPPYLMHAAMLSGSQLLLEFNEPLDPSASDTLHYSLDRGIGHPYEALHLMDPEKMQLFFDGSFMVDEIYLLTINNISDLYGNVTGTITTSLSYQPPRAYQVAITELMTDPFPQVGLPGHEYIELMNRTSRPVDLSGCSLQINGQAHLLPDITIPAAAYLLIVPEEAVNDFTVYGPVVGISSTGLSNEGAQVVLVDDAGNILACVNYTEDWHENIIKKEGGWSLEMIDPGHPCSGEGNWASCTDPSGGTPGKKNSVDMEYLPEEFIENICCKDPHTIEITFSGQMDSISLMSESNYMLDHGIGHPIAAKPNGPEYRSAALSFGPALSDGVIYTINVSMLKDCTGSPVTLSFLAEAGMPGECKPFDVLISEVLFNPAGNGVDFVEIYNHSTKIIDLSCLFLISVKDRFPAPADTQRAHVSDGCRYLFPGAYLALTSDPKVLSKQYFCPDIHSLLKVASFPSYNNDAGRVLLTMTDGTVIDGMEYTGEMHFPLLNTEEGVSLERISFNQPGKDTGNWLSAAAYSGYATPGYENSQHLEAGITVDEAVNLHPGVFSPDGDGKDDVLAISCRFAEPGLTGSVMIFDKDGRLVRTIVGNTLFGTENQIVWDGRSDGPVMAAPGFYIVMVEAVNPAGRVYRYKKAAALVK